MSDPLDRLRAATPPTTPPELDPAIITGAPARHAPRMLRRDRFIRGGAIGAGGLAALTVIALVIGNPAAPPLFTLGQGNMSGISAMASSESYTFVQNAIEYVPGAGLSSAPGRGTVYQLQPTTEPEKFLAILAKTLGLSGEVESREIFPNGPTNYFIGGKNSETPNLNMDPNVGAWGYQNLNAYPEMGFCFYPAMPVSPEPVIPEETVLPLPEDFVAQLPEDLIYQGEIPDELRIATPNATALPLPIAPAVPECTEPEFPAESAAPGESEAVKIAAELFRASGLEVTPADIEVWADRWQTTASVKLRVGGVIAPLSWGVSWSATGEITSASGYVIQVVEHGEYDTISATDAVARIADGRWSGIAGSEYLGTAIPLSGSVASSPMEEVEVPELEPLPDIPDADSNAEPESGFEESAPPLIKEIPMPLPAPIELPVIPDAETVRVELNASEETLLLVYDSEGGAWLVPGLLYQHPEQSFSLSVVSVVEGIIALPEPSNFGFQILPAEAG